MNKMKKWLVVASILILAGCLLFAGVMMLLQWDFSKLSTTKYVTSKHEVSGAFNNISVDTVTSDIVFALSDDGTCKVECFEEEKAKHDVFVENGTLAIKLSYKKAWYDWIGIDFNTPQIKVYLPKATYDTISVQTSTGDVTISDMICTGNISIQVTTGKTDLHHITCKNLTSGGSTGDVVLSDVVATEKITIQRTTGDVTFAGSDAAELFVKISTGDVTGSLLTDKVYVVHTNTGKVDVPKTTAGGLCEIRTNTGDVKIYIQ